MDSTKSKVFADNKTNVAREMISLNGRVENIVGKEKNTSKRGSRYLSGGGGGGGFVSRPTEKALVLLYDTLIS